MTRTFRNRVDAGRALAALLQTCARQHDVVVLALPRGGVPVGAEVAAALHVPLDVFLVRKLGVPGQEELAMGAIASGGVRVMNDDVVRRLGLDANAIDRVAAVEAAELARRERVYRGDRPPAEVAGRTVILVDDGLATGASMRAAVAAVRAGRPARLIVAVPVGARETCDELRPLVDDLVCAETPEPFDAVGAWYADFSPTSDEEVRTRLRIHAARTDGTSMRR